MIPESPTLLSLDTATETLHLGLLHRGQQHVRAVAGGPQASTTLLPALQALMAEAGAGWDEISAVAFGQGPGAFTGLRTACALAQGLALGLGVPVIALDTLAVVAQSALAAGATAPVAVLQDARMGQIYAGLYAADAAGRLIAQHPPALLGPAETLQCLQRWAPASVAGHALPAHAEALAAAPWAPPGQAEPERWPQAAPDGAAQLVLARAAWQAGETLDPSQALPVYVRDKVALTTAERAAAAAGSVA